MLLVGKRRRGGRDPDQLGVAIAVFAALVLLFAAGAMGGGDVKLLSVLALWIDPLWFLRLLVLMALIGGLLTVFFAVRHSLERRLGRVAVPYGVAISAAALWVLAAQHVPAVHAAAAGWPASAW